MKYYGELSLSRVRLQLRSFELPEQADRLLPPERVSL